jgi:hypothetical protein
VLPPSGDRRDVLADQPVDLRGGGAGAPACPQRRAVSPANPLAGRSCRNAPPAPP